MDHSHASFNAYMKFLAGPSADGAPVVLETEHALSLHFDLLATQSFMSRREPDRLVLGYTRTMMGFLLLKPAPARISMIGLGGGSLAKYCYRHLPETRIVAIEVDPEVIALRDTFSIPPDDERLEVICADGAEYVKGHDARPDVILVDGFLAHGMPAQLGNAAFYSACHARLASDGVLVANFVEDDPHIPYYLAEVRSVFGESLSIFMAEDSCNYTLFAWKGAPGLPSRDKLLARARVLATTHPLNLRGAVRRLKQGVGLASNWTLRQKSRPADETTNGRPICAAGTEAPHDASTNLQTRATVDAGTSCNGPGTHDIQGAGSRDETGSIDGALMPGLCRTAANVPAQGSRASSVDDNHPQ